MCTYHFPCSVACPGVVLRSAGRVPKDDCTELSVIAVVLCEVLLPGTLQ